MMLLEKVVKVIISTKKVWLDTMMTEELKLFPDEYNEPVKSGLLVGISALIGSLIPIAPFFFLSVNAGIVSALLLSIIILFAVGAVKAKITIGDWKKSGLEMAIVGTFAAVAGYLIGTLLSNAYS